MARLAVDLVRDYVDGDYQAERRNPFVRSLSGARLLSRLQLPFFTAVPPAGFGVLMTTGRRTGKQRRTCVRAIRDGSRAYLVSIGGTRASWMRNVRADANVGLRLRGGRFSGVAREPRDPAERERARAAYCGTVNRFDYAECRLHRRGLPTRAKIEELHRAWFEGGVPIVVELAD